MQECCEDVFLDVRLSMTAAKVELKMESLVAFVNGDDNCVNPGILES